MPIISFEKITHPIFHFQYFSLLCIFINKLHYHLLLQIMLSPLMSMETIPPTSELMSPVHSFPNRFLSTDFQTDEELNAQAVPFEASVYTYMPVDCSRSYEDPVRSPDVLISNNFMNSDFHSDEVMDNVQDGDGYKGNKIQLSGPLVSLNVDQMLKDHDHVYVTAQHN
ncbi:hypothetical protein Hanom_Chr02g00099931 [Helianthus anomalus]